jgi:protein-S-isoprenylcysteine O-methyltransferase Ste14
MSGAKVPATNPDVTSPHDVVSANPEATSTSAIRAGRRFFPWRIVVGVVGLALGAFVIRPRNLFGELQWLGAMVSFGLVLAGLGLRAWAAACAGGHTRTDVIEAPQLVTGGPYAFVRNPIYLGSLILGLGMIGLLGDPWLLIPHALVFCVFFGMIVPAEEQFLAGQFTREYADYRGAVPRMIPKIRRWPGRKERERTWNAARGELIIGLALVVIYSGFRGLLLLQG